MEPVGFDWMMVMMMGLCSWPVPLRSSGDRAVHHHACIAARDCGYDLVSPRSITTAGLNAGRTVTKTH